MRATNQDIAKTVASVLLDYEVQAPWEEVNRALAPILMARNLQAGVKSSPEESGEEWLTGLNDSINTGPQSTSSSLRVPRMGDNVAFKTNLKKGWFPATVLRRWVEETIPPTDTGPPRIDLAVVVGVPDGEGEKAETWVINRAKYGNGVFNWCWLEEVSE